MKAKLLVNLKIDSQTIQAGKVFDDSEGEFPSFVTSNMDNPKVIQLTEGSVKVVEVPKKEEKKETSKVVVKPKLNKKN
jgi:hypothetical protein